MEKYWILDTHGDPLGALRRFIHNLWRMYKLDAMLAPLLEPDQLSLQPGPIEDPSQLSKVNPFRPFMTYNQAKLLPQLLQQRPHDRIGAILRPCELRALVEMTKHDSFKIDGLLTISVDCLGTYPAVDFPWRAKRKGTSEVLSQESIQFARQGGIAAYRNRSACQTCLTPGADAADINIGAIGLPVRQHLLVFARDKPAASRIDLAAITDGEAEPGLIAGRQRRLAKMAERNSHTRGRLLVGLAELLPADVDGLIAKLEDCGECRLCMSSCPICEVDYPQRGEDGKYVRAAVVRWLLSCVGCGMCEQACPSHLPLSQVFHNLREKMAEPEYIPGRSLEESLPFL